MTEMEKQFTRGNLTSIIATVLSTVVILVGGVTAYNNTDAKTAQNARSIARLELDVATAKDTVQALRITNASTIAQFNALSKSLDELKAGLNEISALLRDERRKP